MRTVAPRGCARLLAGRLLAKRLPARTRAHRRLRLILKYHHAELQTGTPNLLLFALFGFFSFLLRCRELFRAAAWIAFIVGVESLGLEREEEGAPLVAWIFDENGAVLVNAVGPFPIAGVAL